MSIADLGPERPIPPGVAASMAARGAMYGRQEPIEPRRMMEPSNGEMPEDTEPEQALAPAARTETRMPAGLSPQAGAWARKNPAEASKLLEWAASTHAPEKLVITLERVKFTVFYVKREELGPCITFFLAAGAPAVGIEFGTDVQIDYGGESYKAVTAASGYEGGGQFPYARLEFFLEAE